MVFYDVSGRKISFSYLARLQDLQEKKRLHVATKLTKARIHNITPFISEGVGKQRR